ncbi:hypothetical protein ACSQ67_025086 [Phaseolus vulgaris]
MEGPSHSTPTRISPFNSITDNKTSPTQLASHHSHVDSIFLPLYPHSHRHPRHLPNKKDKSHTRPMVPNLTPNHCQFFSPARTTLFAVATIFLTLTVYGSTHTETVNLVVGVVLSETEPHSKDSGCHCKSEEAWRLESDTVSDSNASRWGLIIIRRSRPRAVW